MSTGIYCEKYDYNLKYLNIGLKYFNIYILKCYVIAKLNLQYHYLSLQCHVILKSY